MAKKRQYQDEKREFERLRKADYRRRTAALSHGTVPGTKDPLYISKKESSIYLLEKKESKKVSKKDNAESQNVPGTKSDDWPSDFFEQFWDAYPAGRKSGKRAVEKKLQTIRRSGVRYAVLIAGVRKYASTNPDPQFTKGPEVWLNKGCWDDEYQSGANVNGKAQATGGGNGFANIVAQLRHGQTADDRPQPTGDYQSANGYRTATAVERMGARIRSADDPTFFD
jgi:hypothetical protein